MMDRQPIQRHSWPENDGKRTLSPSLIKESIKRSRSVYLVESPGGTLRQESPTKIYKPELAKLRVTSLPERPMNRRNNERKHKERTLFDEQRPVKPTVYDLLLMGIRRGAEKEKTYRQQMHRAFQCDPQLRLVTPLEDSPCVAGMQKAVDRAMHMSHTLTPEQIQHDGAPRSFGTEVVFQDLIDRRPGQGTERNRVERRAMRKLRESHMEDRRHFL